MADVRDSIFFIGIILSVLAFFFSIIDSNNVSVFTADSLTADTITANEFILTTPVEDDLRTPAELLSIRGVSNTPEWVTFIGTTYSLAFDPTTMEQAYSSAQLPHTRKAGSNLQPHFHVTSKTTGTGNASFCVDYTCANINRVFNSTIATRCALIQFNGTAFKHHYVKTPDIVNDYIYSAMCMLRIYRNATATIDNFPDDALLLEFDIHVLNDKLGENV